METTSTSATTEPQTTTRSTGRADSPRSHDLAAAASAIALAIALAFLIVLAIVTGGQVARDRLHVTLDGTALTPEATGTATLTKFDSGWEIELYATGLPRLDRGRYYQAWLTNGRDEPVSLGTFNEGEDVTLWAGVSPKDFPTLRITRSGTQAAGRGPAVLEGPIVGG